MKLSSKHILESIHKGVSLALDDFDFNDESTSLAKTDIVEQDDTRQQIFKKFVIPEITKLENLKSLYVILLLARYNNINLFNMYRMNCLHLI